LWNGIVAPAGTQADVVATLNRAIDEVLAEPEVRHKLAGAGMDVIGGSPALLGQMMRDEAQKWLPLIQRLGIRPD
jgi:tripartite-type tricarboxylate transporter receptor subunit TctC